MSLMGVGTNILGYSNKEVDETVLMAVQKEACHSELCGRSI